MLIGLNRALSRHNFSALAAASQRAVISHRLRTMSTGGKGDKGDEWSVDFPYLFLNREEVYKPPEHSNE